MSMLKKFNMEILSKIAVLQNNVLVSVQVESNSSKQTQVICEVCKKKSLESEIECENFAVMMFNEFCETTGLHGWKYLTRVTKKLIFKNNSAFFGQVKSGGKILWLMIVLASLAVAAIFLHEAIQNFTSSTVVTTIATTTASLSEVSAN